MFKSKAYYEGYNALAEGIDECPYDKNTRSNDEWWQGNDAAFDWYMKEMEYSIMCD